MFHTTRSTSAKIAMTAAVVTAAIAVTSVASLALFTDQETATANTLGAGTVELTATPATAVLSMGAMAPGDGVTAPVTVTNSGSLDLRYSLTSTTTEDVFAAELLFSVKAGVASCDGAGFDASGTTLYSGILGSTSTTSILGSSITGADPGDRSLAAGSSEVLCMRVSLPASSTNASQGLSTTATFTFDAEQTRNN